MGHISLCRWLCSGVLQLAWQAAMCSWLRGCPLLQRDCLLPQRGCPMLQSSLHVPAVTVCLPA